MEIIWLLVGAVAGGYAGFKFSEHIHTSIFRDILEKLNVSESDMRTMMEDLREDLPLDHEDAVPRIEVKVEQVNGQLYVYRLDTQEFLCQGADREAVLACLADRFRKDSKIILSEEHGAQYLKESPTA